MNLPIILLSLAIFIAPLKAALPDEVLWTPIVTGVILLVSAVVSFTSLRDRTPEPMTVFHWCFGLYVAWAALSLLWQWIVVNHGHLAYLDVMIRTLSYWLMGYVLVTQMQPLLRQRRALYACVLSLVAAALAASYIGLHDYLIHVQVHQSSWREFGTSTPDYFAGFLVMTIPVTLALFFAAPGRPKVAAALVYAIALAGQVLVLPATGSRFALISLSLGIIIFVAGFAVSVARGLERPKDLPVRAAVAVAILLLAGLAVAKPVTHRLTSSVAADQAHSGQFRVWTWRGAVKMAEHNAVFGTGPGTFVYAYQRYALVGYTRVAHNAYLQTADEIGIPGLLFLIAGFGLITSAGLRAAAATIEPAEQPASKREAAVLGFAAGGNDRLLLCGLGGGFAAGLIQNVIDSDWAFTFDGLTMWLLGALILAIAKQRSASFPQVRIGKWELPAVVAAKGVVWCAAFGVTMILWAAAEAQGMAADALAASKDYSAPTAAMSAYQTAISLNPLRADYYSRKGLTVDPNADPAATEFDLRRAAALAPSGVAYRRVATYCLNNKRPQDALAAALKGLAIEPAFTKLWNIVVQSDIALGNIEGARQASKKIVALEHSPVGQIRAVTEIVDVDYVDANLFLGDDALTSRQPAQAADYYRQAAAILSEYAAEDGTNNLMRMPQTGNHADPEIDRHMRDQYDHAAQALIACLAAQHLPTAAASAQRTETLARFDAVIAESSSAK
ncbi:MAG: O-antigen ligase family protein [Capsulimonadaceae bacterium]|nr:O-antigen ligase family protein [Capsulimonadaceae bacterium]